MPAAAAAHAPLPRVVIFGGTHGNELTGVGLVRHWSKSAQEIERPGLEVRALLSNPRAAERTVRYLDHDLNRCFLPSDLFGQRTGYEFERAREILQTLGGPEVAQCSVLLDLHSTTSNMGVTIILTTVNEFNLSLARYLAQRLPFLKVITNPLDRVDSPFVNGMSPFGFCIEVGPVPQGTMDPHVVSQTRNVVMAVLDYCSQCVTQEGYLAARPVIAADSQEDSFVDVFEYAETLDYPRNGDGSLAAMLHPERYGRDFVPIEKGSPLFVDWTGAITVYEGEGIYWPIFIGESAYVEKQTAMVLTRRKRVSVAVAPDGGLGSVSTHEL